MTVDLVVDVLNMALHTRKPNSVIHQSDQGSQYTSLAFGQRCQEMGVRTSMGSVGDAYDNAMAESFFASLECELIARRNWKTHAQLSSPRLRFFGKTQAVGIQLCATCRPSTLKGKMSKTRKP